MAEYEWYLKDLINIPKNKYNVFSCFSCGGGSSMGYKLAGFNVIGNCEIDKKINEIYIKNHHPKYNYCMGIQEMNKLESFPTELYNLDILDGSPPCSTFSLAGEREKNWGKNKKFREGQTSQILDDLFFEFIELADILKPKIVIAENVKGLIMGNAKGYVNLIIKKFNDIGYNVQLFLLNAATMGVPQRRERVFFVATKKDINFPKLQLTFNETPIKYGEIKDKAYKPFNKDTMVYDRWKKRLARDVKISDTVERTEKGKLSGFTTQYLKDDRTPATIAAGGSPPIRFDVPGYASDKDIIKIQTFPQDFDFMDTPYNMGYSGAGIIKETTHNVRERIKNIIDFNAYSIKYLSSMNIGNVCIFTSKDLIKDYLEIFKEWKFNLLVWVKTNNPPMINNNFLPDIEYLLYFHRGKRIWNNGLKPMSIYSKCYASSRQEGQRGVGDLHPTMKPIDLLIDKIKILSKENGIILDLFGGSGSTLIAAEQTKRTCYMMELDPKYCDVIVKRWEKLTNKKAILEE